MSVRYKLYQDNRAESKNRGKWYARAVYNSRPKTLKQMAMEIQENVSVKKSDVLAVLDEMVVVLKKWMQDSNRVKIDGFRLVQDWSEDQACRHCEGLLRFEARGWCSHQLPA